MSAKGDVLSFEEQLEERIIVLEEENDELRERIEELEHSKVCLSCGSIISQGNHECDVTS